MRLTTFIDKGKFYKANLHGHSTRSDGSLTQEAAVLAYKNKGYDFLALTEHNVITKLDKYNTDSFILIPGMELHTYNKDITTIHHMVGLSDMDNDFIKDGTVLENIVYTENKTSLLALEKRLHDLGFLTIYCHPTWSHVNTSQFDFLEHTNMMEVCNYGTIWEMSHNEDPTYWDDWLKQGKQIYGVANDDEHVIEQYFGGWNMVKCEEFSIKSLFESLKKGSFYSTMGPRIDDFYVEDGIAHIECSNVKEITFVVHGWWGHTFRDKEGMLNKADFSLPDRAYIVRAEITDLDGNVAWTNPIMLPRN